jgi:hypothetical protein
MRARLATLLILGTLLFLLTFGSAVARAQETRGYVGGAGLFSIQSPHRQVTSPSFPTTGVGGSSFGAVVEVGRFMTPVMSISAEVSLPARFMSVQETDYSLSFLTESRYRDLIVSVLVHASTPAVGRLRLEAAAGPSCVQESSIEREAERIGPIFTSPKRFGAYGPESENTREVFGVTMGAGLVIAVSSRVRIVPEMRVHWIPRATSNAFGHLGLSSWV